LPADATEADRRLYEELRGMDASICPELARKTWPE